MAAKKDKMIPSEKERKRALKYATPAGTGRMWVTMGIAFIIFGIILLLIPIGLVISEASAQRYLLSLKQGNEYLGLLTESQKASIKRFRSLRSIATAHPFNTSSGGEENFGRGGTEWFVDIRPYGWCDDFLSESSYGFCEDESFSCSEKPDFVMIVYSANNDSRHRRKIYIYKDIIEPLIMSAEFLNKEIKKQNHGTVTPDT